MYTGMSGALHEKMLSSNSQIYDPFQSPPDLNKAEQHKKAMQVGIDVDDDDCKICPCCENIIQKQPISLTCDDEEILFLGLGYPLFYKLTRYFAMIITMIFLISGSGFYFLVTLNCTNQCIYFLGIPIINLQISGEDSSKIADVVNVITAFAIFVGVMYIKYHINSDINKLEDKIVSPEQYTIILQNLPEDINEEELTEWIKENLYAKPILINFAYNVKELSNAYQKRQNLTIKLKKLEIKRNQVQESGRSIVIIDSQAKEISQQLKRFDQILDAYKHQAVSCRKIGTAFVTFAQTKTVGEILQKYETSFVRSFFTNLFSAIRKPPLYFRQRVIVVNQAPAPTEVIWENLTFSFTKSFIAQIFFAVTMALVIFLAFKVQFMVVGYAYDLRRKVQHTKQAVIRLQALAMALIVVIVNSLLRLVIKLFAYIKRYYSYSNYHASFCFYYSLLYILNTCFMIYIVHSHRQFQNLGGLEQDHVLIYDIHLIMLANAFSEPLFKIFDPIMWARVIWKNYVSSLGKQKNPYTQAYVNNLWEGYEISNADNYQYIFRILVVTTWYAHCAPFGVVISLLGLLADYWIGKVLLLRYYKRPQNISKKIAMPMIMSLEMLPLVYICGVLQFTYKVSNSQNLFSFLIQFLQYGITTTVILICILGYLIYTKPDKSNMQRVRYDEVEVMFPYNYETENPITKLKGEIKYLYGVLKRGTNKNDSKIIKELLSLKQNRNSNKQQIFERQSQIIKIKKKNLKRLGTLEQSIDIRQQMQLKQLRSLRDHGVKYKKTDKKDNFVSSESDGQSESD